MVKKIIDRIQWDWSMNVGNIIALVAFLLAGVGAWYDIKGDVKIHQLRLDGIDKHVEAQFKRDAEQDIMRDKYVNELKQLVRDENREVRQEIRDLRSDLMRQYQYESHPTPTNKPR